MTRSVPPPPKSAFTQFLASNNSGKSIFFRTIFCFIFSLSVFFFIGAYHFADANPAVPSSGHRSALLIYLGIQGAISFAGMVLPWEILLFPFRSSLNDNRRDVERQTFSYEKNLRSLGIYDPNVERGPSPLMKRTFTVLKTTLKSHSSFRILAPRRGGEVQASLNEAVQTVHQHTVPQDTIPQDVIPQDTIPQDTIPQDTIPRYTIPQDTIPQDTIPQGRTPTPQASVQVPAHRNEKLNSTSTRSTYSKPSRHASDASSVSGLFRSSSNRSLRSPPSVVRITHPMESLTVHQLQNKRSAGWDHVNPPITRRNTSASDRSYRAQDRYDPEPKKEILDTLRKLEGLDTIGEVESRKSHILDRQTDTEEDVPELPKRESSNLRLEELDFSPFDPRLTAGLFFDIDEKRLSQPPAAPMY